MIPVLTLQSYDDVYKLDAYQANQMELKLNLSKYAHEWKQIGDQLYIFTVYPNPAQPYIVDVSLEQFKFLKSLITND